MGKVKTVVVFFSGGLDSTYLVWKNLTEGNIVYPVYVDIKNNINKTILEKNRIKILHKLFTEEFNKELFFLEKQKTIFTIDVVANENSLYFKQIPIWILGALYSQGLNADEIQIGYVMNDDAISYLNDIQNIYRSYQVISEKLIPLKFPITKITKWQMARDLPERYFNHIVSCENPEIIGDINAEYIEYKPCCDCVPCSHIISTNYYTTHNYPKNYKKPLIDKYKRNLYNLKEKLYDKNGNNLEYGIISNTSSYLNYSGQLSLDFPAFIDLNCPEAGDGDGKDDDLMFSGS